MRLSQMTREQIEAYVDAGQDSRQDVLDLYDDLQKEKRTAHLFEMVCWLSVVVMIILLILG